MTAAAPVGFSDLWASYPWPADVPFPEAPLTGRDSEGFDLLLDLIRDRQAPTVVMEVGSEFGGSTRRFLDEADTWVVSVDPWPDSYGSNSFPELKTFLQGPGAMHQMFQTFCWEHRDRLATVREFSPAGPLRVYDAGVPVDLIYIDGDHRYDAVISDLNIADALFPDAVLCGDDWQLKSGHKKYEGMGYPVRRAVESWAAFHDCHVEVAENTWLIDKSRKYNLKRPPARFVATDHVVADIQARLKRIEKAVSQPSAVERAERKTLSLFRR